MTEKNGIENLENHKSEENPRVGPSHDLDGKFLAGHPPLKGAGRPPGSRKAARDLMNGALDAERFKRIVDAKLRTMAMGAGQKSLNAAIWIIRVSNELAGFNSGQRRRRKKS